MRRKPGSPNAIFDRKEYHQLQDGQVSTMWCVKMIPEHSSAVGQTSVLLLQDVIFI